MKSPRWSTKSSAIETSLGLGKKVSAENLVGLIGALTTDALFIFNADQKLVYCNALALGLRKSRAELFECNLESLFPMVRFGVSPSDGVQIADAEVKLASGQVTTWRLRSTVLTEGKHLLGMAVLARELFPEDRTQDLIRTANRSAAFNDVSLFVSHEINGPLSNLTLRTLVFEQQLEKAELSREELLVSAKALSRSVARLSQIVRDFNSLGRNERNEIAEKVAVRTLVEDALSLLDERFKGPGLSIHLDMDSNVAGEVVQCRPVQIVQVLVNLLNNAGQATMSQDERWIRIATKSSEEAIEIAITDSGSGIAPDVAERIFEPFFTTKPPGQGTGIGLSLARKFIQDHHGLLTLETPSETQPHTRFIVLLPKRQSRRR